MEHHNIKGELPKNEDQTDIILSKIFDLILKSMGEEKRRLCIDDAKIYVNEIPPAAR
jgi:hypothetical protein